ncbi:uncharacterized protein LOC131336559 [Rhododendron vialii]|uniref:uncharacterized protein LOC131336559 n=1 Tax=Rhododendron vialii TaxID=182163 RepID=UPI00265E678E|nr:uncharacterized protein LOC131336559 [Rhododendron vialii]
MLVNEFPPHSSLTFLSVDFLSLPPTHHQYTAPRHCLSSPSVAPPPPGYMKGRHNCTGKAERSQSYADKGKGIFTYAKEKEIALVFLHNLSLGGISDQIRGRASVLPVLRCLFLLRR